MLPSAANTNATMMTHSQGCAGVVRLWATGSGKGHCSTVSVCSILLCMNCGGNVIGADKDKLAECKDGDGKGEDEAKGRGEAKGWLIAL